jgi:hypothetical protein
MKKFINNILAPTPRKNKRDGRIATAIGGIAETIALSGAVDNKPLIKYILHGVATYMGIVAINNASKTIEEDEPNN